MYSLQQQQHQQQRSVQEGGGGHHKKQKPNELTCRICGHLMKDAVLVPCCGKSFCKECTYIFGIPKFTIIFPPLVMTWALFATTASVLLYIVVLCIGCRDWIHPSNDSLLCFVDRFVFAYGCDCLETCDSTVVDIASQEGKKKKEIERRVGSGVCTMMQEKIREREKERERKRAREKKEYGS